MRSGLLVAAAVAIASMLPAGAAGQESLSRDQVKVLRGIQRQVLDYVHYTVFDSVSAQVNEEGVVTLTGKVTMPYKRDEIEKRVSRIAGVRQVNNRIEILPASKSDDEIRLAIARAIYNNPTFQPYASRSNPPIHVIVERGRVVLEGVVRDESERLLALSLAGSQGSLSITDQLMTEEEARREVAGL
jgi:hyperosmotically inducible protein